jgi:cystathionine beta-lyase
MYDFTTPVRRPDSVKWQLMLKDVPNMPDDVVPLTIADMEWKNAPEIIEGLKMCLDETILGYQFKPEGYADDVISWMKRRHGASFTKEAVVPVSGVVPAIYTMIRTFSEPGQGVIVMPPVYYPFFAATENTGRVIVECPLINDNLDYRIDFFLFEQLASDENNKIVLFCSPHNPVGRVWTKEELDDFAAICVRYNLLVISDEIHFDLISPGAKHIMLSEVSPELAARTVVCTAPTKTFNIAALDVANLLIPDEALRSRFCDAADREGVPGASFIGAKACQIAYRQAEGWLNQALVEIAKNDATSREFFASFFPEVGIAPLEGTYVQWLDFRALLKMKEDLTEFLHREAFFYVQDGRRFGTGGDGFYRLNLALPNASLIVQQNRLARAFGRT